MPSPCASCSTPIPDVVADAPFCPYCGIRKGLQAAAAASNQARLQQRFQELAQARAQAPARPLSTSYDDLYMTFDPRAGFALLGAYAPDGEQPRLRAYDVYGKRVAWDAFTGDAGVAELDYESIAVRNGNVYVGVGRSLRVLDLFTGQQKWGAEMPDTLAHDMGPFAIRGARVVDPAPPGARGPVWVVAIDDTIAAFDRDTGQQLWRETRENMPRRIHPFESGLVLLDYRHTVEMVDPATRAILDTVGPRVERLDLEGRYGVLQVERWGWRERDGILVHDFLAKKEALFEAVENAEDDVQTVTGQGRVFCALENGAKLFAAPRGKPVELVPGMHIKSLVMCGPTLMVMLRKQHGTSYRRVLGVDPQTLAVRFDLGEWSKEPDDYWEWQICSNGHVAVVVNSPTGNDSDCELLAVDPAGRILWRLPVKRWKTHYFLGGHLVVTSSMGWQIVRPDTGQAIATYDSGQDWRDS